jgi:peptide deformylase
MNMDIVRIGTPSLRQKSQEVPVEQIQTEAFQALLDRMLETMAAHTGAGIAAPQIGVNLRVMIFEITHNPRYPEAEPIPLTFLINPSFEVLSPELQSGEEGCLSVGELRGMVPRYMHIRYKGLDRTGAPLEREVSQFHARVFQHEYDHLEGTLFIDRVVDTSTLGFRPELLKARGK